MAEQNLHGAQIASISVRPIVITFSAPPTNLVYRSRPLSGSPGFER
jgi:hypothetical protein